MSMAYNYRKKAARLISAADRLSLTNCTIFADIARKEALILAKRGDTAHRWEIMAATPLAERPGGFPGDPYNSRGKVKPNG